MLEATHDPRFSLERIDSYYRETRWQYRGLWTGKSSLALHYGFWDKGVSSHAEALHRLNQILADEVAIGPTDYVLDAGCGWGGSAIWLVENRNCRSHGINIVADQIDKAREKATLFRVNDRAAFSVQNYHATGFADATFDVVWAVESICHSQHKQAVIDEAFRVLKPGGRLVISDFLRSARPMSRSQERALASWIHQWVVPDLATLPEMQSFLEQSGFMGIRDRETTSSVAPSSLRLFKIGLATTIPALMFRLTGIHSAMQHANWKSSIYQYLALRKDAWRYGILSAKKP